MSETAILICKVWSVSYIYTYCALCIRIIRLNNTSQTDVELIPFSDINMNTSIALDTTTGLGYSGSTTEEVTTNSSTVPSLSTTYTVRHRKGHSTCTVYVHAWPLRNLYWTNCRVFYDFIQTQNYAVLLKINISF